MLFDDAARVAALHDYRVLDTAADPVLDGITRLACSLLETPIALVSLLDSHRQWFKSKCGLEVSETPRELAFCDHAIREDCPMAVEDATTDPRFFDNPLVTGEPHIRFYCGIPLRTPDGHALGTLCVIDRVPRTVTPEQVHALSLLAKQAESALELRRRLALVEEHLTNQQALQQSRELLSSMLVHDLRAPVTNIALLAMTLSTLTDGETSVAEEIALEAERMGRMLSDVLDVCLAEVGQLRPRAKDFPLAAFVEKIVRRFGPRCAQRDQHLTLQAPSDELMIHADAELLERVLENLLSNACAHAPAGTLVAVSVARNGGAHARVDVSDQGPTLDPELGQALFLKLDAFASKTAAYDHKSHGLGLAFCRLAIEAHGGQVGVEPRANGGNTFFFELPLRPAAFE